jgi:hypothetical protein
MLSPRAKAVAEVCAATDRSGEVGYIINIMNDELLDEAELKTLYDDRHEPGATWPTLHTLLSVPRAWLAKFARAMGWDKKRPADETNNEATLFTTPARHTSVLTDVTNVMANVVTATSSSMKPNSSIVVDKVARPEWPLLLQAAFVSCEGVLSSTASVRLSDDDNLHVKYSTDEDETEHDLGNFFACGLFLPWAL